MLHAEKKAKLLVVTVVWGDWHIGKYFNLNLPTLLADGNFPALARHCDLTYVIYTSQADMKRVKEAPQLRALAALMKVEFRRIGDEELKDPMVAHHAIWNEAANHARASGSFILLMPPDVVWSNGSFAHVGRLLEEGKQAIFMSYLRAESESFTKALERRPRADDGSIALSGAEMVDLCLTTLHPLMPAYMRDSSYFPIHAEMMLWPVRGEGLLCRTLAREMFVYNPANVQLNSTNLLDTKMDLSLVHVVHDSDDLFAVSLAPLEKEFEWYRSPQRADPGYIGEWWLDYDSWINDVVAGTKLRWHTGPVTEAAWRAREQGSDLFLRRAGAVREGRRLFRQARELNCHCAASLLAVAVQCRAMPHVARGAGGATVFLPTDAALAAEGSDVLERLLEVSNERELVRFMRAHFVPGKSPTHAYLLEDLLRGAPELRLRAADGSAVLVTKSENGDEILVNGHRIVGARQSGKNVVYAVDGVLAAPGPREARRNAVEMSTGHS